MKHNWAIIIAILSFVTALSAVENAGQSDDVKVEGQIAELEKLIMPPAGIEKANVDVVYGEPKETKELKGKGSSADYPIHTYELLPPAGKEEVRAFLYVTYRVGKVWRAGINHICVVKNRALYQAGSAEDLKQKLEIERENHQVLIDLNEIRDKFSEKLKNASWNKKESELKDRPNR